MMLMTIQQEETKRSEPAMTSLAHQAAATNFCYSEQDEESDKHASLHHQNTRLSSRRRQARRQTKHNQESSSTLPCSPPSPSSSFLLRKCSMILLLFLTLMPAQLVHSATFFYGATDDVQNSPAPISGPSSELSSFSSGSKLSEEDLKSVYTFCSLLPTLQSDGRVPKNDQSREICEKLIVMLNPMFAKRKTPEPSNNKKIRRSVYSSHRANAN